MSADVQSGTAELFCPKSPQLYLLTGANTFSSAGYLWGYGGWYSVKHLDCGQSRLKQTAKNIQHLVQIRSLYYYCKLSNKFKKIKI